MSDETWMPEYDEAAAMRLLLAVLGDPEIGMPPLIEDPTWLMLNSE